MERQEKTTRSESWLLYAVTTIVRKASDRVIAPLGISIAQMPFLVALRDAKQPITVTEVARRLYLEIPSVTTMIDRLCERGLVERADDPQDRRKTLVSLTENGERLAESICEPYRQLHEEMFGVLDDDERENLTAMLQKLRDANLYLVE